MNGRNLLIATLITAALGVLVVFTPASSGKAARVVAHLSDQGGPTVAGFPQRRLSPRIESDKPTRPNEKGSRAKGSGTNRLKNAPKEQNIPETSPVTEVTFVPVRSARPTAFHGDVRQLRPVKHKLKKERPEPRDPSGELPATLQVDSALQPFAPAAPAPTPARNFAGLDFINWGDGWPPDTNGDVGPNHYIQTVNTSVGIYNKTTGVRLAAFTFNTLFSSAASGTPCDNSNQGDPVVLYDALSDRWIISDFAWLKWIS